MSQVLRFIVVYCIVVYATFGAQNHVPTDKIIWEEGGLRLKKSDIEWRLYQKARGAGEPVEDIEKSGQIFYFMKKAGDSITETYGQILSDEQVSESWKAVLLNDLRYLAGDFYGLRQPIRDCLSSPSVSTRYAAIAALAKWGNDEDLDFIGDILSMVLHDVKDEYRSHIRLKCIHALANHGKERHIRVLEKYIRENSDAGTGIPEQARIAIEKITQRSNASMNSLPLPPAEQNAVQAEPVEKPEKVDKAMVPQPEVKPLNIPSVEDNQPEGRTVGAVLPVLIGIITLFISVTAWILRRRGVRSRPRKK